MKHAGAELVGCEQSSDGKETIRELCANPGASSGEEPSRALREGNCLAPRMLSKGSPRGMALKGDELFA